MRAIPFFLILITILAACAPVTTHHPEPVASRTTPREPTPAPTKFVPEAPTPNIQATLETSLLATQWQGKSKGNILFPADPATGTPLPEYTPISLGLSSFHIFSPDRRTLAVVTFPNDYAYDGSLLLIDLPGWRTQRFELELRGWVNAMVFSPDGKQLAISHGDSRYTLTIIDTAKGVITAQSQTNSFISRLKFTDSGEALMLYGPTNYPVNGLTAGPPQVLLLDVKDLTSRWSVELEEVHDGIFPKDEDVTAANIHEPGQAFYISPGLAFAPDRDALYVVHADSEQLTTVDFAAQKVETVEIQTKLTWFERLLSITAGVAYAKIGDGIIRQAAVSPDGQFLYVVGVNNATFQDKQGNWQMEQTPFGLEIIQTRDGNRVEHIETDTTELSLSPDGRFLYLRNWGTHPKYLPWTEIFDTSSQQFIARKDNLSATPALLMNGEFLLTSTFSTSEYSHHMSILEPDGSSVLAEWTDSESVWWLTAP